MALNPIVACGRDTPANIDTYAHTASVSQSTGEPGGDDDDGRSSSSSSPPPQTWPELKLDSGASYHVVRDARLLSDLQDVPAGQCVVAADGNTLAITKIGNIRLPDFTIPSVCLVPGLKFDGLISVRQLARQSGVSTLFVGDRAMLYAGPKLVGVAVAPQLNLCGLYVLRFLSVPKIAAASSASGSRNCLDEGIKLVPVWCGSSSGRAARPEAERFTWSQFSPLRVHTRKQLRLRLHMQKQFRLRALMLRNAATLRETI